MSDSQLVEELRALARSDTDVAGLLQLCVERLGSNAPIPTIDALRSAFGLPISVAKHLLSWRGFAGGLLSDEEAENIAGPRIKAWCTDDPDRRP